MDDEVHFSKSTSLGNLLRRLPHNVDAEMAVLGAIILNNRAYDGVSENLLDRHFIISEHKLIFSAITNIIRSGGVVDPITLREFFLTSSSLDAIGGIEYLMRLADCAVTPINAREYANLLVDLSVRRDLIDFCEDLTERAYYSDGEAVSSIIGRAEDSLSKLDFKSASSVETPDFSSSVDSMLNAAEAAMKRGGGISGLSTGIKSVDSWVGGLQKTSLIILGGRPSMGKTALGLSIAAHVAKSGKLVLYFSLEMSRQQLSARVVSCVCGISSENILRGNLTTDQFADVMLASREVSEIPLLIHDVAGINAADLRSAARRAARRRRTELGLIVVDHIGLMSPSDEAKSRRSGNRTGDIGDITASLKRLAKDLDVPVVALSQLSRNVEFRDNKRPQLSDLRDSGSIEQDADVVAFVYREHYYLERSEPQRRANEKDGAYDKRVSAYKDKLITTRNVLDVIGAKNRLGSIRTSTVFFDPSIGKITDLAFGAHYGAE